MKASDLMTLGTASVHPDAPLAEVLRLMLDHRIGSVPVVDDAGSLKGIVSDADFFVDGGMGVLAAELLALDQKERQRCLESMKASEIMQANPLCADSSLPIGAAARQLASSQVPRMPVIEGGKLVGMLSRTDYLEVLAGRRADKD